MSRTSNFTFRTRGGVCAGETWIYDNDEPIACLENKAIEQPEQNLRYFNGNAKPVNLRYIKLKPGGRPLVDGVQMFWVFEHRVLATSQLDKIEVAGQGTDRLVLTVTTSDPGGVATSRRVLELSWDEGQQTYIYDFKCHLDIHSPEVFDLAAEVNFEYCDPWFSDIPGPTVEFSGMWQKRFSHLVAELSDDSIWQMPINHLATGIPGPKAMKRDGIFAPGFDAGNNPAFEFVGSTGDFTSIGVCNWGYDIHFAGHFAREQLYGPLCPHFRLRLADDEHILAMMQRAAPVPPVVYEGFEELPLYERRSSFEKGQRLDEPTPGNTDPWPWLPRGEGLEWCRDFGRSDEYCLKIAKDSNGPAEWVMDRESEGAWTERWTRTTSFRVRVWIKTAGVEGRGACLALRWGVYNYPEHYPYVCSQRLKGDNDWTQVEVQIDGPSPADSGALQLILRQDGTGITWFDDLEVEILDGVHLGG